MNNYDLTDTQKELLRLVVKRDEENRLAEKGMLHLIRGDDKYMLLGCGIELESLSDLDALCDVSLLSKERVRPDPVYRIKNAARNAVANDFQVTPTQPTPQVSIGTIIHSMSGGNIQAIGNVQDSTVSQIINDPELLRSQVETLTNSLLHEVESVLSSEEYTEYLSAIQDLKKQILEENPNQSLIKRLVQTIGLLGDVEGTIGLMTRVWPLIQPLLVIIAAKFGQAT